MLSILYEFTISDKYNLDFFNIWDMAYNSAKEQENYEFCMGGEEWPEYTITLTDFEKFNKLKKYHFKVIGENK